jgi:hypothetical protein
MSDMPGFWMYEVGGQLQPAVRKYLCRETLSRPEVELIRAYLMQWIAAPGWNGDGIQQLRDQATRIQSERDIDRWLLDAESEGIDPL